jgi:hypothetical protein
MAIKQLFYMLPNSAAIPLPAGFAGLEIPLPEAAADPTKSFVSNDILCQMGRFVGAETDVVPELRDTSGTTGGRERPARIDRGAGDAHTPPLSC